MRLASVVAMLVLLVCACAAQQDTAPLTMEERVAGTAEAPGSEPDPVETPLTATGLEELESEIAGPPVRPEDIEAIGQAGFVAMRRDTRFFPSEPGGEHIPGTSPHVSTVVYQFESEDGANAALDVAHSIGLRPCPDTCAYEITQFQPADVPNARGVQAIASQESIDRVGDDIEPDAQYSVYFADGPFLYEVTTFGPPDGVSVEQTEEIASELYQRVKGAPTPEPS